MMGSEITLTAIRANSVPASVTIELSGPARRPPSTSNDKVAAYRKHHGKTVPFIRRSDTALARLKAMSDLYFAELFRTGLNPLTFGATPVAVTVYLATDGYIKDSHNYTKPIGDWLQEVGLIRDDKDAQIHCYKKADYKELFKGNAESTTIEVVNFNLERGIYERLIKQRKKAMAKT